MLGLLVSLPYQNIFADDLVTLFDKAKLYSPHLPLSIAQREVAIQKLNQAKAGYEPKINFSGQEKFGFNQASSIRFNDTYRLRTYGVQFSMPVYDKSQDLQVVEAEKNVELANLQLQSSYDELLINIVEQYFKILNLKTKIQNIEQQKNLVLEQKKMAIANFNHGMVSITDLREVEAKFSTLQAEEESLHIQISKEIQILADFVGQSDIDIDVVLANFNVLPEVSLTDQPRLIQDFLNSNNQIKIQTLQLQIAKNQLDKVKAEHSPTLNFNSRLNRNFDSKDSAFSNQQDGWDYLFGLELNISLYNAENKYKTKEYQANIEKSKYELALATQKQKGQLLEVFFNTLSSLTKVKGMLTAENSAQQALVANTRAYEVGMRVNADVLEAQSKYFEIQQERLTAWYETWQNYLKLQIIRGTFTDQDLQQMSKIFNPKIL